MSSRRALQLGDVEHLEGAQIQAFAAPARTREEKLLASATGSGASIDELDESVTRAAQELFEGR